MILVTFLIYNLVLFSQMTSQEVLDQCSERQLCFISFLPHILDSMAEGRNNYIEILKGVAEKYKQRSFG